MISRRKFLEGVTVLGGTLGAALPKFSGAQPSTLSIDRAALVSRHNPVLRQLDPLSPLTVGNGEFAADVTGLQTLHRDYENAMPLCTMSQWGWHTRPAPDGLGSKVLRLTQYDTYGREVGYQTSSEGQTELYQWLRENPHRLHLGRIALSRTREPKEIKAGDLSEVRQELDLWRGTITSSFRLDGKPVTVRTAVDPRRDLLAVSIQSTLIDDGTLGIRFDFPYGSPSMQAADWQQPGRHRTEVIRKTDRRVELRRGVDADRYFVSIAWEVPAELAVAEPHSLLLSARGKAQTATTGNSKTCRVTCRGMAGYSTRSR
jgi:protein-glucosylgalactosylhydroxylysine glucosidase